MKSFSLASVTLLAVISFSTSASGTPFERTKFALIHCNETSIFENDEEQASFPGTQYTWTFNGKMVREIEALKNRAAISSFGDLLINRFTNRDHGVYICEININTSGIRVVDIVKKNVDDKYALRDMPCSLSSCIVARKCFTPSLPHTCLGNDEICCSDSRRIGSVGNI